MSGSKQGRVKAVFLALLVTVLWSSSFVLIKIGLTQIPAVSFAGTRYFVAFLVLAPFLFFSRERLAVVRSLARRDWAKILLLGVLFYTCTQASSFIGLSLLPAVMVSLTLSFTPFLVVFSGMVFVSAVTCLLSPLILNELLRRWKPVA